MDLTKTFEIFEKKTEPIEYFILKKNILLTLISLSHMTPIIRQNKYHEFSIYFESNSIFSL